MRRTAVLGVALALVFVLGIGSAFALTSKDDAKLSGPHWQFNIIGHPNNNPDRNFNGDDSSGRVIMVPLRNLKSSETLTCPMDGVYLYDRYTSPYMTSAVDERARIYWEVDVPGGVTQFTIVDRDAMDGSAKILVPYSMVTPGTGEIQFDIYMRVQGKPSQCMNIDAWAYDADQGYFYAGSVQLSKKKGKQVFTNVADLFDVVWCADYPTCTGGTQELSVFNDVFDGYFWQVLNDGTRNVQVRIYPKPAQ